MNNVPGFGGGGAGTLFGPAPPQQFGAAPALGFGPGGGARRSPEAQRPLWTEETEDTTDDATFVPPVLYVSRARSSYNGSTAGSR